MPKLIQFATALACLLTPLIAESLKDKATRFYAEPEMKRVKLSPGGSFISYIGQKDDCDSLFILNLETQKGNAYIGRGQLEITKEDWIDDTHMVYYLEQSELRLTNGEFYMVDTKKSKPTYLCGKPAQTIMPGEERPLMGERSYWVDDPLPYLEKTVLLRELPRNWEERGAFKFVDLYKMELPLGDRFLAAKNPGWVERWMANPATGEVILGYSGDNYTEDRYIYRKDAASEWGQLTIPGNWLVIAPLTNTKLMVTSDHGAETRGLGVFDTTKGELSKNLLRQAPHDIDVRQIIYATGAPKLAGVVYSTDTLRTRWMDSDFKTIGKLADDALPGACNIVLGLIQGGKEALILSKSDTNPGQLYRLNFEKQSLEPWLKTNSRIDPKSMAKMQAIQFTSRDGKPIYGYLSKPLNAQGPTPLIVDIIGGPRTRNHWGFDSEVQYFASLGFAVLQVNYRGCDGYGMEYMGKNLLTALECARKDSIDGAKWALEQGIAAPGKIAVYGGSFGGYAALGCAADAPDLFACAIGFAGVYDWEENYRDKTFNSLYTREWDLYFFQDYRKDPAAFHAYSPIKHAENIRCPILLLHGKADWIVSYSQSVAMHNALKKASKNSTLLLEGWGGHGYGNEKDRIQTAVKIGEFLQKNLGTN